MVAARVAYHMEILQAESFPQPEIVVHHAAETGAAYGAACMLHQRFMSLESDLYAEETGRIADTKSPTAADRAQSRGEILK
jgi:hypothetical protein